MINKSELINELISIGCYKEGKFKLKSGIESDYYLDFRNLISYPELLTKVCGLINEQIKNTSGILCGLPYAGIPYAQTTSVLYNRPCILLRKEQKKYGTCKMIEGVYRKNDNLIIIDDIITKGTSIYESLTQLTDFNIQKIVVLVDREEGGKNYIEKLGFKVESIFTVNDFKNLSNINKKIFEIKKSIIQKKSNICISLDYTKSKDILDTLEKVKNNIIMIKLHCDIIEDFTKDFIEKLTEICMSNNILIFEDRKFSDIGSTFVKQFTGGHYKISSWCNITNFHTIVGDGIVKEFNKNKQKHQYGLMIAEMSNEGNLIDDYYTQKTIEIAKSNREDIIGFICQQKISDNSFIYCVPGISLEAKNDNSNQKYTHPITAIENGADILIIGRGIINKQDVKKETELYQSISWKAYKFKNNIV